MKEFNQTTNEKIEDIKSFISPKIEWTVCGCHDCFDHGFDCGADKVAKQAIEVIEELQQQIKRLKEEKSNLVGVSF